MKMHHIISENKPDMEKIAFGDLKNAAESDTKWEAAAYRALESYVMDHTYEHRDELERYLPDLFKMKSKYPNDLILGSRVIGDKVRQNKYYYTRLFNRLFSLFFSLINLEEII